MIWFGQREHFVRRSELGLRIDGVLWATEWGLGLFGATLLFRRVLHGYDPTETEKRIVYLNWQVVPCSSG